MTQAPVPPDHYHTPDASMGGRLWRWLTALSVFAAIGFGYGGATGAFNGMTMAEVSARYPTLLTPSGYAFSIWGLIYAGLLVYAGWQLLPAQRLVSLPDAVARPLTLANLGSAAWVVLFAHELLVPCAGLLLFVLAMLIVSYGRARRRVLAEAAPAWVSVPFAVYLGWVSVATTISLTIALQQVGFNLDKGISVVLTYGLIFFVVLLGLIMSRAFGAFVYALTVAWALVGVWLARLRDIQELGWAALAGATIAVIGGVVLARQLKKKAPWEVAAEAAAAAEAEIAAARLAAEQAREKETV